MRRSGVNRRQVPQLKAGLEAGKSVAELAGNFNCELEVIFDFAKGWGIKLKETPESVKLQEHDELIESEVSRRLNERLALGGHPKATLELRQPKTPVKKSA